MRFSVWLFICYLNRDGEHFTWLSVQTLLRKQCVQCRVFYFPPVEKKAQVFDTTSCYYDNPWHKYHPYKCSSTNIVRIRINITLLHLTSIKQRFHIYTWSHFRKYISYTQKYVSEHHNTEPFQTSFIPSVHRLAGLPRFTGCKLKKKEAYPAFSQET